MSASGLKLLDGFTALDLSDIRGQFCGKCLTDLGMEVIKVEPPEGDGVRRIGPFKDGDEGSEGSLRFAFLNSGKKSVVLDIGDQRGRDLFLRLVEGVDVLLESHDPGALERMGLSREVLWQRNPGLVICSLTGFGQDGPYRDFAAPHIVSFAMSGLMYLAGEAGKPPTNSPDTQGFYCASLCAAYGILLALWRRDENGRGEVVDVSVQEVLATQEHILRIFGSMGQNVERQGSQHPFAAPANIFPTQDGYVFLFVSRVHWPLFLDVWEGHPKKYEDPEWAPDIYRRNRMDVVNEDVAALTRTFSKKEFADLMQAKGIPCLPVNAPGEFARDEHAKIREMVQTAVHPVLGEFEQVGVPLLLEERRPPLAPPPLLGEHTKAVLCERLGMSPDDVDGLLAQETA